MTDEQKKVLSKLQAQCARREYCSSDVFAKALKALEGDRDAAAEVVESLVGEKYVDDLRYATAFCREKAALQGWGAVKISYMLAGKGIDKATISAALAEIDSSAADRKMESVLRAKLRTLRDDPQVRFKMLRFALSRGYSYDSVAPLVDRLLNE